MATAWNDYLTAPSDGPACRDCHLACGGAFQDLRATMRRVIEKTRPRTVACLGAGMLNDIPYASLVGRGATVHLVDWLPELVRSGIARSIIACRDDGSPECAYCLRGQASPQAYCRNFVATGRAETENVCDNFRPGDDEPMTCAAFELGERPYIHGADATGGLASAFGQSVAEVADNAKTWRQAFRQGTALAGRVRRHRHSLDIADGSVDLVTSSMVISQFEHEPYDFFATQMAQRLGMPTKQEEKRLRSSMETLRANLTASQIERHCDEIERMLAPGGCCFMAFETFHRSNETGRWFLVEPMHDAIGMLARRFDLDFGIVPAAESVLHVDMLSGRSVIRIFLLRPRGD